MYLGDSFASSSPSFLSNVYCVYVTLIRKVVREYQEGGKEDEHILSIFSGV